ncbi:metalloregulator ArsR/SmtB family transcription factor [Paracoccus sp. TK19116]|uniref:Metalloregulator ArsR/SmtB family transcription factor n=1 Tax=Paracoccus albicereus TaxID=2922394 RepID=A0ABT1MP33_9RHOB|nr:metalloregulator ArsR/SmtB family transcription factor [Paracoccus albicereus]MCQ0970050.1 metalloregulator ArsR/SmtB family transcription factor [Paracoccus albicereus]
MANLDRLFNALSDPTRRAILQDLRRGPATAGALGAAHPMALPSFMKHLGVLERAGLIETEKQGRTRSCRLAPGALVPVSAWLADQRLLWEERTERLAAFVENHEERR